MALSRSAAAWHSSRYWRAPELVVSIEEQCDAANAWHDEHQELEALCREVHCHVRQAGDIAPRPGEARDELAAHRIGHRYKHDRDRLRGPNVDEAQGCEGAALPGDCEHQAGHNDGGGAVRTPASDRRAGATPLRWDAVRKGGVLRVIIR